MLRNLRGDLANAEDAKAAEEEEARRRALEEAERRNRRVYYVPIKGDPVDEKIAFHINACEHYVPVKRLGDGQYLYGQRKIFAKIMNEKLVIRVGGGYMLIDEFLKNYAEAEEIAFKLNN